MNDNDYFYFILYHALVQKVSFASDYKDRLLHMTSEIEMQNQLIKGRQTQCTLLTNFMQKNKYKTPKPTDLSVGFHPC